MLLPRSIVTLLVLTACSPQDPAGEGPSATGVAQQAPVRELIFNTYLPPQDAVRRMSVDDLAARIETESEGTLKITIPGSSLANSSHQWSIVTEGVADLAVVPLFTHRAKLRLAVLGDLPLNCFSGEAASVALWKTQQQYFDDMNEFSEVELLGLYVLPPFQVVSNVKPITTIEDFRGLKIWVAAGPPTEAVELVNAVPVFSLYSELYGYASKGFVDALMIGPGTVKQAGIGDYVRYMTEIPGGMGSVSFAVVMNKDVFRDLSESQQAAIRRAAEGLPRRVGRVLDERNVEALEDLQLTINQASPELMEELDRRLSALQAAWVEMARQEGLSDPEQALEYYRNQMAVVSQADRSSEDYGETSPKAESG